MEHGLFELVDPNERVIRIANNLKELGEKEMEYELLIEKERVSKVVVSTEFLPSRGARVGASVAGVRRMESCFVFVACSSSFSRAWFVMWCVGGGGGFSACRHVRPMLSSHRWTIMLACGGRRGRVFPRSVRL